MGQNFTAYNYETILGIRFFQGSLVEACEKVLCGGLTVAPSGPGLALDLTRCEEYARSLKIADLCILDSGLVTLWGKMFIKRKLIRISGLAFLKYFLLNYDWKSCSSLWIMPDRHQSNANLKWLKKEFGHLVEDNLVYIAPKYHLQGKIVDEDLLDLVVKTRPRFIFIQLGGGVQERLGLFLKESFSSESSIICTGAALAFLSGQQVKIPNWADYLFSGWIFRCIYRPKIYLPRYLKAFRLFYLLFRYGKKSPHS